MYAIYLKWWKDFHFILLGIYTYTIQITLFGKNKIYYSLMEKYIRNILLGFQLWSKLK